MELKKKYIPLLFLFVIVASIFWQFFLKNQYPFPGNFLLAWFEPYKSDNFSGQTITLAHKAIAEDTFRLIFPLKTLAMEMIKAGQPPLWNPYNGSGMPLLAAINIGYLDPLNILFFVLPNYLAWSWIIIIDTLLIATFTYLYAKSIKLSSRSSFLVALVFVFSGPVISRSMFTLYNLGVGLLPILLLLFERYRENFQKKYLFVLAPATGILLLSTHPQYVLYILIFVTFYWLFRSYKAGFKKHAKEIFLPFFFILIGIGFASVQLIPAIELFQNANLNSQSSSFVFDKFLLPLYHFVTLFIPNYFGNPATYNYWETQVGDYIDSSLFLGLIPSLFVFCAIFNLKKINKSLVKFFIFVIVITLLSSLKWPFSTFIYSLKIPLLSIGVPSRVFYLTTFSLSMICGFGYEYWQKSKSIKRDLLKPFSALLILTLVIFLITLINKISHAPCPGLIEGCRTTALRNTILELGVFLFSSIFIITHPLINLKKHKLNYLSPLLVVFIIYLLGIYNSSKLIPFSPKETFFPENKTIEAVKRISQEGRVFGVDNANITTDFATALKFYDPAYFHPFYIKSYAELVAFANNGVFPSPLGRSDIDIPRGGHLNSNQEFLRKRLMDLVGIEYVLFKKDAPLEPETESIWGNSKWYMTKVKDSQRIYLVNRLDIIKDKKEELERLFSPSFDPRTTAVVEQNIPGITAEKGNNRAEIKDYEANKVSIETNATQNTFLVLSDNYYPGWKAFLDGKQIQIYKANYTFRGVKIPQGKHHLQFIYDPLSFKIGAFLSIFFFSVFILIILFPFRKFGGSKFFIRKKNQYTRNNNTK